MRIVITGSSCGIGRVLAESLLRQGHRLWGLARRAHGFDLAQFQKADNAPEFRSSCVDVSVWSELEDVARQVNREWDGVDALIHCAARLGQIGPSAVVDPSEWSQTVRVTLDGTFNTIMAFFPLLQRSGRRSKVICFSGGGATGPRPNFSAYAAAKAGVVRLVETLAAEWTQIPIDINAVAPGALPTSMTNEVLAAGVHLSGSADYEAAQRVSTAGPEMFKPVCGLIDYLLSEHSDGIVGRLISAQWDNWPILARHKKDIMGSDIFTLRRIIPSDRGVDFS